MAAPVVHVHDVGDFASGFGVGSKSTVGDLLSNVLGFDGVTIGGHGGLLDDFGLSDQSTIDELLEAVPGLGGNTLSGLVGDLGVGDEHLADLASSFSSTETIDQYLTNILDALQAA